MRLFRTSSESGMDIFKREARDAENAGQLEAAIKNYVSHKTIKHRGDKSYTGKQDTLSFTSILGVKKYNVAGALGDVMSRVGHCGVAKKLDDTDRMHARENVLKHFRSQAR